MSEPGAHPQIEPDRNTATQFLLEVYKHRPSDCFLTMVFKRRGDPLAANKPPMTQAMSWAATEKPRSFSPPVNVACHRAKLGWESYFNCALHRKPPPPRKRGREDLAGASCFAFLDIDVGREGHKEESGLCPNVEAALEILGNWLPPTAIVLTGGGVHSYWRFDRPWIIDSDESRGACKAFHKRFQWIFRTPDVNPHGFKIDDTHNLAQILRVPGTFNWKSGEPRPVTIDWLHDLEYSVGDLGKLLPELVVPIVREPTGPKKLNEAPPPPTLPLSQRDSVDPGGVSQGSSSLLPPHPSPKPATATTLRKARRYVAKIEPGISGTTLGRYGHGFRAVLKMIADPFYLSDSEALEVLRGWAGRCVPPFTDRELLDMMKAHRRGKG